MELEGRGFTHNRLTFIPNSIFICAPTHFFISVVLISVGILIALTSKKIIRAMRPLGLLLSLYSIARLTLASEILAQVPLNSSIPLTDPLHHEDQPPDSRRLIMYVQTFSDTAGQPLSLLPLLEQNTRVTHVILGALHLHEEPGKIMLNNDYLDSTLYEPIWKEVRILQSHGIKVMALLGGAAGGSYHRLSGNDSSVCSSSLSLHHRH